MSRSLEFGVLLAPALGMAVYTFYSQEGLSWSYCVLHWGFVVCNWRNWLHFALKSNRQTSLKFGFSTLWLFGMMRGSPVKNGHVNPHHLLYIEVRYFSRNGGSHQATAVSGPRSQDET